MSRSGFAIAFALTLLIGCAHKGNDATSESPPASSTPQIMTSGQASGAPPQPPPPPDQGWPRSYSSGDTPVTIYQPQLESWDGFTLKANTAVEIDPVGGEPVFGIAQLTARTTVDYAARTVQLDDVKAISAQFPSAPKKESEYLALVREAAAAQMGTIALDRLEADLAILHRQEQAAAVPVRNAPPAIVFSLQPAVLVYMYGEPRYEPVKDTKLWRVINTRVLLFKDQIGVHYLHLYNGYVQAPTVNGPWTVAAQAPAGAATAEDEARKSGPLDLLEGPIDSNTGKRPVLDAATMPQIYVATKPTELIVTQGAPDYVPIEGTQLLYVKNTDADVFRYLDNDKLYVLISGRWFAAASMDGPWSFVPGTSLPADFKNIPDSSPKAIVKVSVPGTPQAREAVITNSIPHTAWVSRTTKTTIPIDGPPKVEPITGTPLSYVANSEAPIIKVDSKSWYACQNGVWFVAKSATGPWTVAASVPAVIYSIPPSSPIYYVTYVRVYGMSPYYVYVGYLPGYYGTVVAPGGVVVYGTGYYYSPWVGTMFYAPPVTYGVAAVPYYAPAVGFAFGFAFGAAIAPHPYYWGPAYYAPHYGYASAGVYGRWGNDVYSGTRSLSEGSGGAAARTEGSYVNERTGAVGSVEGGRDYDAYTGTSQGAYARQSYNPNTGVSRSGEGSGTYDRETGDYSYDTSRSPTGPGGAEETTEHAGAGGPGGADASGTEKTFTNPNTGRSDTVGVGHEGGTTYATNDGNMYRNSGTGWEKQTAGGWQSADAGASSSLDRQQSLQRLGSSRADSWGDGGGFGDGSSHFGGGGGWGSGGWGHGDGSFSNDFGGGGFRGFGGGGFGGGFRGFGGGGFGGFRR